MTECWDRLAYNATQDLPRTCRSLVGRFAGSGLRQCTLGPKQRVWYRVAGTRVTIETVHRTQPKATDELPLS